MSLDEDDIDFLESVLETERAKENEVKKETAEQLDVFKRQQEEEERQAKLQENLPVSKEENPDWSVATKKRKKQEKEGFKGIKLRKTSSAGTKDVDSNVSSTTGSTDVASRADKSSIEATKSNSHKIEQTVAKAPPKAGGLGLVAYSDSESE